MSDTVKEQEMVIKRTKFKANFPVTLDASRWIQVPDVFLT